MSMDHNLKENQLPTQNEIQQEKKQEVFLGIWTQTKTPRNKMQLPSTTGRKYFRECFEIIQLILFTKKTKKIPGRFILGRTVL